MGIFTIAGGKGGVGKSTTTATLGVALSEAGYEVALVDADLAMANLADVLGVPSEQGIHRVLAGETDVHDVLVESDDGPDLVPGGRTIEHFEACDPANLREVIQPLGEEYDVVLVDTGAGLTHEALVATGLADGTMVVTTPQDEAVADVAKTVEFVDHADAAVLGALVARTDEETDLGSIADRLDVPIVGTTPEDPAVGTEPATAGATGEAYRRLAATLATHLDDGLRAVGASASVDRPSSDGLAAASSPTAATGGVSSADD